jgi:hypothetical protein
LPEQVRGVFQAQSWASGWLLRLLVFRFIEESSGLFGR